MQAGRAQIAVLAWFTPAYVRNATPARTVDLWYQALQYFRRQSVESVVRPPLESLRNKIGQKLKAPKMRQGLAATVRELAIFHVMVLGVTPVTRATRASATGSSVVVGLAILWACMLIGEAAALLALRCLAITIREEAAKVVM